MHETLGGTARCSLGRVAGFPQAGTGTGTTTVEDVPTSAWLLGWASLAGQLVTLVERGPADQRSGFHVWVGL